MTSPRGILLLSVLIVLASCLVLTCKKDNDNKEHGKLAWKKTFGGVERDGGSSVQQTPDEGFMIAGYTWSSGSGMDDVYLVRTDAAGGELWAKTVGGPGSDWAESARLLPDGGFIIAGATNSFGAGGLDVYLVRIVQNGDTLWTRTYGGPDDDWGFSVQLTNDGGYVIAGMTQSFGEGGCDVYLLRTDSLGDTVWTRTYGGADDDWGFSVRTTLDGGYVVSGWTESFGAGRHDALLVKIDSRGNEQWRKTYGGSREEWGFSVEQTMEGGYIVAGYTWTYGDPRSQVYLVGTNEDGDSVWTKNYVGTCHNWGVSVARAADSGYVVVGSSEPASGSSHLDSHTQTCGIGDSSAVFLMRLDARGDTLWTRTYATGDDEYGRDGCQTLDGGYVIVGGSGGNAMLLKASP